MNLFQRINEVRKAVAYVQKDKSVSTGGGSYKAVTHDMVTAIVRGPMVDHGIVCFPSLVASEFHLPLVGTDGTTAKQRLYEATYDFRFVNADEPKDDIVVRIQAHAMDNADKAPGKALSYAKKYAVLKLFEIETGEDEESRVPDQFDPGHYIALIAAAESLDDLKKAYAEGFGAAGDAKDKSAQKQVIAAKDKRKGELTAASNDAK